MSDLISRDAVMLRVREFIGNPTYDELMLVNDLNALPSADEESFEWCTDCKEYDQEKHCCHRWTKVIRQTVEEMKAESERTVKVVDHKYRIGTSLNIVGEPTICHEYLCGACKKKVLSGDDYCSHCGAKLDWSE